jgi:hypothetical protein
VKDDFVPVTDIYDKIIKLNHTIGKNHYAMRMELKDRLSRVGLAFVDRNLSQNCRIESEYRQAI